MRFPFSYLTSRGQADAESLIRSKRWLVLGIGIAAQAAFSAAFQGLPAVGNQLRTSYSLSLEQLGFALAAIYLGIVVSEVIWGILTDYIGERVVLVVGLLGTASVLLILSIFSGRLGTGSSAEILLAVGFLFLGILGGSVNGSSGRAVMAWFRVGERGLAMSLRQTAVPVGGAIGAAVLPLLAGRGFSIVFGFIAGLCMLTALAALLWLTPPPEAEEKASPALTASKASKQEVAKKLPDSPLRHWTVWRIALASGLLTIPQFAAITFVPAFLHDDRHLGAVAVSIVLVTIQLGGASLRVITGIWSDRLGQRRPLIRLINWITVGVLCVAAAFAEGPIGVAIVALILGGIFASSWHGITYTEIAEVAGASRSGTALGLENTTVFLGAFITPIAGPAIVHASSWPILWATVAGATAISLFLLPKGTRLLKKSIQSKGTSEVRA